MDIVREKSFYKKNKTKIWGIGGAIGLVVCALLVNNVMQPASIEVISENLLTDTVSSGELSIKVQGHGKLVPKSMQWVSAVTVGKVEEVMVKPGSPVTRGDVLARLSNPDLQREAAEQEWDVEALEAEQEAKRFGLQSSELNQRATVLKAKYEYVSVKTEQEALDILMKSGKGAVSAVEYAKIKLKSEQLKEIWGIEVQKLEKLIVDNRANVKAMAARANQARKSLEFKRTLIKALNIVASSDGVVQEVLPQVGQTVIAGMSLFKIVDPKDVIAEIEVPEVQAGLIQLGQSVNLNLRTSEVPGKVSRIDPAVINGTVKVDVQFDSKSIKGVRPDLSVEGEVVIDALENVMYIRRPSFSQENRFSKLYVLDRVNGVAHQKEVKFGRSSADKIQVVAGLTPGQVVILNNPTPWLAYKQIQIK